MAKCGAAQACRDHFGGGSGSLILQSNLTGAAHYSKDHPDYAVFTVGQIEPTKGYVHVFDEIALDIVLKTLDTISDFVQYLDKKEQFMSVSSRSIMATGEEELLAYYLTHLNRKNEHDFVFPKKYKELKVNSLKNSHFSTFELFFFNQAQNILYNFLAVLPKYGTIHNKFATSRN